MQLSISKHYFYELKGIIGIKAHIEKLSKLEINETKASGEIELNLSYSDSDGMECFKVLNFPFDFELDELKIIDINLSNVGVCLVESSGVDIEYSLIVNYLVENDKIIEPIFIDEEEQVEVEQLDVKKIKEDISSYYEEKLADQLESRNNEVIITKSHNTTEDFLSFFDEKISHKYSIITVFVEKEEDLNKISIKYKIPMNDLLKGYDKKESKVMFKLDK